MTKRKFFADFLDEWITKEKRLTKREKFFITCFANDQWQEYEKKFNTA